MRMIKEVLRLYYSCGLSHKKISKALGCSHGSVAEYIHRAQAAGLTWPLSDELDDAQINERLFPGSGGPKKKSRPQPDCAHIHQELKKKGVTLVQLWTEYRDENPDGYGLTQFCEIYSRFSKNIDIAMRQEHKAGEKAFSDFAGKTLPIVNPQTGEVTKAHLFVCTLGASSFTFAELFSDESTQSWCNGHARAFEYFDGITKIVVPDNPKPVVTKACPYEPDVNPSFAQMAAHYDVAVIPARIRKPKDKAKVEAAVGIATRWILAVLRHHTFFSLAEANSAVRPLLNKLNDRPFKRLPGSRRSLYETIDRPALRTLPVVPFEYAYIKNASVNIDYHIDFDSHFYSVPHQLRQEVVELRVTSTTIEILHAGKRVASHVRKFAPGRHTTLDEHRPRSHQEYGEWPPERLTAWATKIGPSATQLVESIMQQRRVPEQGYRSCMGILRLGKTFGNDRLEAACSRALSICAYSYKSVKSILSSGLDQRPLPDKPHQLCIVHSNIRGAVAYSPSATKEDNNDDSSNDRQHEDLETVWHGPGTGDATGTEGCTGA
jgi:transposase